MCGSTDNGHLALRFLYLNVPQNKVRCSLIVPLLEVFIGTSHKKIKFFAVFAEENKRVFYCFLVLKSGFLQRNGVLESLERTYENYSGC